jgi:DNA-binding transcriptional regulator YdaS (Cro superfamily)
MVNAHIADEDLRQELREMADSATQAEIAASIGVSEPYLSQVLSGKRPVGPRIASFLGYVRECKFRKID